MIESPEIVAAPAAGAGRSRRRPRLSRGLVAVLLVGAAYASVIQSFSWNQTSHYALIRALAHGTAQIDPYIATTGDDARFHGHWYSARAPGLALAALPWYELLHAVHAEQLALDSPAQRGDDEMIWAVGLWGSVLPALLALLLVRSLAERVAPGYGTAAAVATGLGTLLLPLGTLLFSHALAAMLALAAFALLWRDRDGPRRLWRPALAGLALGYAITSEYPSLFAAVVLGVYLLADREGWLRRALAYVAGAVVGVLPLAAYDRWAFGSIWHVAYADLPPHQSGFFGIRLPSPSVLASLLFSSRGLLTLSPVLALAAAGTVLLYRLGRRAESAAIAAIALADLAYNAGYYLPFGGAVPGPRFLLTAVVFLSVPLALAIRRWSGPAIALAAVSATTMLAATVTHPLVGYQPETAVWTRYLAHGLFQPTVLTALGFGRGWVAMLPLAFAVAVALLLAADATPAVRLDRRALAAGAGAACAWAIAAAYLPALLGIDSATEHKIADAGDPMTALHSFGTHPLLHLVVLAAGAALAALAVARVSLRRTAAPAPA